MQVNNSIYETYGHAWWSDEATFDHTSLRYCVNPVRYGYFARVLREHCPEGKTVLDVGSGGGYLSEEFAKGGYRVSGIEPAVRSVEAARCHAAETGLDIDYRTGRGESLPFPDASFDIVACCDVLEHVDDPNRLLAEISRVLKSEGIFLFDTVNRTARSKFILIKVWQDWGLGGLREPNVHVWEKFIKPDELEAGLRRQGFSVRETRGMSPRRNPLALVWAMVGIRTGRIRNQAMAPALGLHETGDLGVSYMGWAVKRTNPPA